MWWVIVIAAVLASGCKSSKRAAAPPPSDDAAVDDAAVGDAEVAAEDSEAVDLLDAADLEAVLERRSGFASTATVIYLDQGTTDYVLKITSTASDRIRASLPAYVFARYLPYEYPYGDEGCLPPWPWLARLPDQDIDVAPGSSIEVRVTKVWYLGNEYRPQPQAAHGSVTSLELRVASEAEPFVRIVDAVRDLPKIEASIFMVAGGCTPEAWMTRALEARLSTAEIRQIDTILRDVGLR